MDRYHLIPADKVAADIRPTAEKATAFACTELGIARPAIQWYAAAAPDCAKSDVIEQPYPMVGWARSAEPRKIWLHAEQSLRQVVSTAAHECRHLWQWKNGHAIKYEFLATASDTRAMEFDASDYAAEVVRRFYAGLSARADAQRYLAIQDEGVKLAREAGILLKSFGRA